MDLIGGLLTQERKDMGLEKDEQMLPRIGPTKMQGQGLGNECQPLAG
jgi:hypothetical protein